MVSTSGLSFLEKTTQESDYNINITTVFAKTWGYSTSFGDGSNLVFPMRSGRPISASTLPKMLQYHRITAVGATVFRSSFRDWAAEETDHPREVIEAALAHVVQNRVEAAYARSDLFERRRRLMANWAAYLNGESEHALTPPR